MSGHTPGPWYVVRYNDGHDDRETLQNRDAPITRPSFCFNTEPGHAQAEADRRNAETLKEKAIEIFHEVRDGLTKAVEGAQS